MKRALLWILGVIVLPAFIPLGIVVAVFAWVISLFNKSGEVP
jgi:hypothetical protein